MPLDPDAATLLAQMPAFDPARTPAAVRAEGAQRRPPARHDPDLVTRELVIDGAAGPIGARHYLPPGGSVDGGLLVYFHGGGFVLGDLESHDPVCRALATGAGAAVLAVDYRLAPEHPFPCGVDDAWAALRWAHDHAGDLGADPTKLAVGGDSAGGNFAAVTALRARDGGVALRLQLLVYPGTDFSRRRPSYTENAAYVLTPEAIEWFERHYAPDRTDWRASPLLAPDLAGVAAAVVLTCEYDPLRDEGNAYAERLRAAGVAVEHVQVPGMIHGALSLTELVPAAGALMETSCRALRAAFAPAEPGGRPGGARPW